MCALSLILYLAAMTLLAVGIATPEWYRKDGLWDIGPDTRGLWQKCLSTVFSTTCSMHDLDNLPVRHYIVIGLVLLAALAGLLAGCCYAVIPVTAVIQMVAGGCAAAGVVLYGVDAKEMDNLGYSFGLVAGSAALFVLNSILLLCLASKRGCHCKADMPCRDDFV